MRHEPWRNRERVCKHIYQLLQRAFGGSHALSCYRILALIAMFMIASRFMVRTGGVHIGTQNNAVIPVKVKVSKTNLKSEYKVLK